MILTLQNPQFRLAAGGSQPAPDNGTRLGHRLEEEEARGWPV
jgi:hypothetical protein